MKCEAFLSLLQFSDGLFPAGAYAHSFGLESYVAEGAIRDAAGVEAFLLAYLQGSMAHGDAIAASAARRAALLDRAEGMRACITIDHLLDAMKPGSEPRDASRQMGRQVLRIAAHVVGNDAAYGIAAALFRAVESGETPGHHAMAFGAVGGVLGWLPTEMTCAYLYATCAGLTAGALRLLPLGQSAGQKILWAVGPCITSLAEEIQGKDMDDIWSFAPGIEIAGMRHAMLDARLFRS